MPAAERSTSISAAAAFKSSFRPVSRSLRRSSSMAAANPIRLPPLPHSSKSKAPRTGGGRAFASAREPAVAFWPGCSSPTFTPVSKSTLRAIRSGEPRPRIATSSPVTRSASVSPVPARRAMWSRGTSSALTSLALPRYRTSTMACSLLAAPRGTRSVGRPPAPGT